MADATVPNLSAIKAKDSVVGRAIEYLADVHNNVAQQTNASPVGETPAPGPHVALDVAGGGGFFRANITDGDPGYRGKEHFLEVSEDASFQSPHVIHLGASTSWYGQLGEKNLHFRSYSQYATSPPSEPVYHNNVSGAGGTAPSVSSTQVGGQGYGAAAYRTATPPKRS